jgi:hypothetical protein
MNILYRVQYEYGEARGAVERIPFQEDVAKLPKPGKVIVVMSDELGDVSVTYLKVEAVNAMEDEMAVYRVLVRDHMSAVTPTELKQAMLEPDGNEEVIAN